jgi:hypothetical protein
VRRYSITDLDALIVGDAVHEECAGLLVVLEPDGSAPPAEAALRSVPAIFASTAGGDRAAEPLADVVCETPAALDLLIGAVSARPLAATALVLLLRQRSDLVAESAAYSMLQAGPEFAAWRHTYTSRPQVPEIGPAVVVERSGDTLRLTLSRPHVHNAVSRRLRDELADALTIAHLDDGIRTVELRGAGASFCSGGDLAEFGTFPDPVRAHLTRLTRSPARLMEALGPRLRVHLHGAAMGAGIELPAFAGHVSAAPDTVIGLPELGLGLIPGAGGTVSLPRRIGRHRTAWLALTGERIDAPTALAWGLVDEITA